MNKDIIQVQKWKDYTRYIILNKYGSIILDLFNNPQQWWSSSHNKGTAWIWALYILSRYRLKGHAKELLEKAENIASNKKHKGVYMVYEKHTTPKWVLDFYIRRGYKIVENDKNGFMLYKKL